MLVALVGVDCAGKTTQVEQIATYYSSLGVSVKTIRLGHKPTVQMLLSEATVRFPAADRFPFGFSGDHYAVAYYCDFVRHYHDNVQPLLNGLSLTPPSIIVSDRYALCYKAYAEAVGAESPIALSFLDAIVPPPDLYLCLDLDLEVVKRRMTMRQEPKATDETDEILSALIRFYRASAEQDLRIHMIDANRPRQAVLAALISKIDAVRYAQR